MKKTLLIINSLFILCINAFAQIPNSSFEDWEYKNDVLEPVSWLTNNVPGIEGLMDPITFISRVTPAQAGDSAVMVQTVAVNTDQGVQNIPGFLTLGQYVLNERVQGFPYTERPSLFTGYYKFDIGAGSALDSAMISVILTKWNPTTNTSEEIGGAGAFISQEASEFTAFEFPFFYEDLTTFPDSMQVTVISSAAPAPVAGTSITIDNLQLITTITGLGDLSESLTGTVLYPNPASSYAAVRNLPSEAETVEIVDFSGRTVTSFPVNSARIEFSTSSLSPGAYIYKVLDKNGVMLEVKQFSVVR